MEPVRGIRRSPEPRRGSQYEDCVECGTCDIMCTPGSVKWNNPRGGFGVKYRYG